MLVDRGRPSSSLEWNILFIYLFIYLPVQWFSFECNNMPLDEQKMHFYRVSLNLKYSQYCNPPINFRARSMDKTHHTVQNRTRVTGDTCLRFY